MDQEYPRLQKALAAAGVASRRACEEMITQGRISVIGQVIREMGVRINTQTDEVRVDGEPIRMAAGNRLLYIALNKPVGVVSTVDDPHAQTTVLDLVAQVEERVYPVGRLDADSSGLLLLTNDGEFANRLTHPRYHVPKTYRVRARGFVSREAASRLAQGVDLPDGRTAPSEVRFVEYDPATQSTILELTLYEGRNRQVRRMLEAVGHPVRELTRIAFGNLRLRGLAPGTWRKLRSEEVAGLLAMAQPQVQKGSRGVGEKGRNTGNREQGTGNRKSIENRKSKIENQQGNPKSKILNPKSKSEKRKATRGGPE